MMSHSHSELTNSCAVLHANASYTRYPLSVACNAAHPMWERWRNESGYFVVEADGRPCWVGRAVGDMKAAFARWMHAGAPNYCDDTLDSLTTVLFVALTPSALNHLCLIPGRTI